MDVALRTARHSADECCVEPVATGGMRAERAVVLLLVVIGFVQFQPGEPFLVDFLVSKGFTNHQVADQIFNLFLYCRLPALLLMGIAAELCGAARTFFLGTFFGIATTAITVFCTSLLLLQVSQVTVALSDATHTGALYALLFELSSLTSSPSQVHVHWACAVVLLSNCVAGVFGSGARRIFAMSYAGLAAVTLAFQLLALVGAAVLACAAPHLGLRRARGGPAGGRGIAGRPAGLWADVIRAFSQRGVGEWTLWSVVMHTGHLLTTTYWQALLREKLHRKEDANGFATAVGYFFSFAILVGTAKTRALGKRENRRCIAAGSLLAGGVLLLLIGVARTALSVYSAFVAFQMLFRLSIAAATQQVGAEVRSCAEAQDAGVGAPRCGAPRARVAMVFSLTQVFGACVQVALQYGFGRWRRPDGQREALGVRFQAVGLGMVVVGAIWGLLSVCAAARARGARPALEPPSGGDAVGAPSLR